MTVFEKLCSNLRCFYPNFPFVSLLYSGSASSPSLAWIPLHFVLGASLPRMLAHFIARGVCFLEIIQGPNLPFQTHCFIIQISFIRVLLPRPRTYFHPTRIYGLSVLYQALCWVLVATVMSKLDMVSWTLHSGAMFFHLNSPYWDPTLPSRGPSELFPTLLKPSYPRVLWGLQNLPSPHCLYYSVGTYTALCYLLHLYIIYAT